MRFSVGLLAALLVCVLAGACTQVQQEHKSGSAPAVRGTEEGSVVTVSAAQTELDVAARPSGNVCTSLLDVLAACAKQAHCDDEMTMFLPSAARSSLIAAERLPGFSEDAFDRYCLQACQTRRAEVNEVEFARGVCEVGMEDPDGNATRGAMVMAFLLNGGLQIGEEGAPLAEAERVLGVPERDAVTSFECDSAFEEGDIRELRYPGLVLETDGGKVFVRSMSLTSGNRLLLSNGEVIEQIDENEFQRRFGARAERVGDVYRVAAGAGGDWETAYDFHFERNRLVRVDYWIGC